MSRRGIRNSFSSVQRKGACPNHCQKQNAKGAVRVSTYHNARRGEGRRVLLTVNCMCRAAARFLYRGDARGHPWPPRKGKWTLCSSR